MEIYSETIFSFIEKCEKLTKEIINNETPFSMGRSRVLVNSKYYPLNLVVLENEHILGQYFPNSYKIGLNKRLVYSVKEHVLKDIIRHELAHFFTDVLFGQDSSAHGENFKKTCELFNWGENISKASLNIEETNTIFTGQLESEKIIFKIKKLMELANSENEHEAALATAKANKLLLKYNLESAHLETEFTYVDTIYKSKKNSSKVGALYQIISYFLVKPLIVYKKEGVHLEVTGKKENIELAHYIIEVLDKEIERLWKSKTHLKGLRAKNSFIEGLAVGFSEKMEENKANITPEERKSLVLIDNKLQVLQNRIHRRISKSSSNRSNDIYALKEGKRSGHSLNINPALKNKNKKSKLLSWRK